MELRHVEFEIKREEGRLVGFSLFASGSHESEAFCLSFPTAMNLDKAEVRFEGDEIVFIHKGISIREADRQLGVWGFSSGGRFTAPISSEDGRAIQELLSLRGLTALYEFNWRKGFTLSVS